MWLLIIIGNLLSFSGFPQQAATESIEMADAMRASGKIYVVVLVVTIILAGLIFYLIKLDRKIIRLEKEISIKVNK